MRANNKKREANIVRVAGLIATTWLLSGASCQSLIGGLSFFDFNQKLAERWAPIHHQDVDTSGGNGIGGKSDFISAIDFDGNWNTKDNFGSAGIWERKDNPETFASFGVFAGDNGRDNAANAPWGWDDKDDGPTMQRGEIATDPAKLTRHYFDGRGAFSHIYTYNPYQDIICEFPNSC